MMGERSAQDKLFAADHIYLDYVGRDTLYGYLAQHRGQLFRDEDFAILHCRNNGRPSAADLKSKWSNAEERAAIIAALEERGISFDELAETSQQPDADPFDL